MILAYPLRFEPEPTGGFVVQGLPPLTGVITEGDTLEEAKEMASDALNLVLAAMLDAGDPIPHPPEKAEGPDIHWIFVDPYIAAPIMLRWAREDEHVTQAELAARLGVTRQAVQKLERSTANPSIKTLTRAFKALGRELKLAV